MTCHVTCHVTCPRGVLVVSCDVSSDVPFWLLHDLVMVSSWCQARCSRSVLLVSGYLLDFGRLTNLLRTLGILRTPRTLGSPGSEYPLGGILYAIA